MTMNKPERCFARFLRHLPRLGAALLLAAVGLQTAVPALAQAAPVSAPTDGCAAPAYAPGATSATIASGGISRDFIVYIPATLPLDVPAPLVFALHGFAGNAAQQRIYSGWDAAADANNLIVVYAQGTGFPLRWHSGGTLFQDQDGIDDVVFMRDLVDHLENALCIDSARIYVNGLSNGGGMSYRLACEASDLFAAWGGVAGAYSLDAASCQPSRAVPAMVFHGTTDPIVPYTGQGDSLPDIETFVARLATGNGCDAEATESSISTAVDEFAYSGCDDEASVLFYRIAGGGHTWPGSASDYAFLGETTQDIDATALLAAFFLAHPLP